ncbi:MAG TPA: glycosyltransferase [Acidobacteriota bacterium]|jgi:UDP-N-acetylglucosamine:LPS N-acetylglucosamine transferase
MSANSQRKRFLFLSAHTGNGHNSAAAAVAEALQSAHCRIHVGHPMEQSSRLCRHASGTYNRMLRSRPERMNWYYRAVNLLRPNERRLVFRFFRAWGTRFLREQKPDVVVSFHPMTNHFFAHLCRQTTPQIPMACVVTDPGPGFWRGWTCAEVDRYFVATEEARQQLLSNGIAGQKIAVTGMPVQRCFETAPPNLESLKLQNQLDPGRFTLLLNSGWVGNRIFFDFYRQIALSDLPLQLIFVHGFDWDEPIQRIRQGSRVPALLVARTDRMHELMSVSDLMISKAGALTMFEAFAVGLPVAVNAVTPIMTQERGLAETIRSRGLGFWVEKDTSIIKTLARLVEDPMQLAQFRSNIRAFYRPGAAQRIAAGLKFMAN